MSNMKRVSIILKEISLIKNSEELLDAQKAIMLAELRAEKDRILGQAQLAMDPQSTGKAVDGPQGGKEGASAPKR